MQRHASYLTFAWQMYHAYVPHTKSFTVTASVVQCACGSAFVSMGAESNQGPDLDSGIRFFYQKLYYMSIIPRPPERRSSSRRNLQPSKESIQHFKTIHLFIFFSFVGGPFVPRKSMQIHADPIPDPDSQYWLQQTFIFYNMDGIYSLCFHNSVGLVNVSKWAGVIYLYIFLGNLHF